MGQRIKALRKKHKMNGRALAGQIGITPSALSSIECGHRGISIEVAAKIAEIFGVSVDYILGISADAKMSPEWEGISAILRSALSNIDEKKSITIEKSIVENTRLVPYLHELKDEMTIADQLSETTERFFVPASCKADFVIDIGFDLLEPEYLHGDIVTCILSEKIRDGDFGTGIFYQKYDYMFRDESKDDAPLTNEESGEYIFRAYKAFSGKVILSITNPKYLGDPQIEAEKEISIFEFRKSYKLISKITGVYRLYDRS